MISSATEMESHQRQATGKFCVQQLHAVQACSWCAVRAGSWTIEQSPGTEQQAGACYPCSALRVQKLLQHYTQA
jgi:hypothetical protein